MNLNDRALLVQLSISQWSARKFDKKATKEVADRHGTSTSAGRYNKALLPMNDLLDNVHKKSTLIRQEYYDNTLPWGIDGTMMLPTSNYLQFMTGFRKSKADWEWLVNMFLSNYDALILDARRQLGSLYNPADYPSTYELRSKFKMEIVVYPVPSGDFRVSLASEELSRIQQDVEARVRDAGQAAMREVWQRLYDKVKHSCDKLSDPKAIFRDSLIENIREVCAILPRLNFSDDPNLEAMRQEVEASLLHNPDTLRNALILRQNTAQKAKAIMDKMSVFMGDIQ